MTKCDNDAIEMPTFLSSDYAKIPHGSDGNVSLSQVLSLIVSMKAQLSCLEKKCLSTSPSTTPIVETTPSIPAEKSSSFASVASTSSFSALSSSSSASLPAASSAFSASSSSSSASLPAASSGAPERLNAAAHVFTPDTVSDALASALPLSKKTAAAPTRPFGRRGRQQENSAENRVKRNFDRNKSVVIGKKPSSGAMSWRGAPLTTTCYIGRVDVSVTCDDIKADVISKGIDVIEIEENVTRHQRFKSFKLVIKKTDYEKLDDRDEWPEGVIFRRFFNPRVIETDGATAPVPP